MDPKYINKLWCKAKTYNPIRPFSSPSKWVYGFCFVINDETYLMNPDSAETYRVNSNTVCRCANVKDSVGNMLYEADLFNAGDTQYFITYDDSLHAFIVRDRFSDRYYHLSVFPTDRHRRAWNMYD